MGFRFTDDEMARIYKGYRDETYIKERTEELAKFVEINEWFNHRVPYMPAIENLIKPFVKLPVTVLDWGGDTGHNAPFENDRSLLHVYDIGDSQVIEGAVKIDYPEMKYDLVVCANVLEHVSYPVEILKEIVITMDSNSVLFIEVPYELIKESDLQDSNYVEGWHEHINYFSIDSIHKMLDAVGVEVVDALTVEEDIGNTDMSMKQILIVGKLKA